MPKQAFTRVYDQEYHEASQFFVYLGDIWIDEITSFSYEITQNKQPIYGYASQLWDECAAGTVLVQGQFSINFKEQGYLWAVLRRYFQLSEVDSKLQFLNKASQRRAPQRDKQLFQLGPTGQRPLVGSNGTQISRASIERLVRGEATTSERYQFYNDLAGYATFDIENPRDKVFEDIVEVFEDQIWKKDINNLDLLSQIRRTDDNKFDGFDIYIIFGDYSSPGANHTTAKLIDVRLLGHSKQVQIGAGPIQENYSFYAKSVV